MGETLIKNRSVLRITFFYIETTTLFFDHFLLDLANDRISE